MRIPEISDRLRELAVLHEIPELASLADHLRRRPPVKRAPISSEKMTPTLRAKIRAYARDNPTETNARIGELFKVNHGRVSEALAGFRE